MEYSDSKSKRILFVCQYFYPETFRGNDVAFYLAKKGHQVHVVTGIPNYPGGQFFSGYGLFSHRHEVIDGVKVTRLPIVPRGKGGKLMLLLNYFSYFMVAWTWMLFHSIKHRYDMVFCQQLSPVMMSAPAILYKRLRKVPLYTWVLDLWPESLSAAGGIHNKYVLRFFDYFVRNEYKYSDKILISSRSFEKNILTYGDYADKLIYYPQWADGNTEELSRGDINEALAEKGFSAEKVFSKGSFCVMFAGAVGEAHGMECNMKAALLTKLYKNIKWVIVGDGRKLDWVRHFVQDNDLDDTVFLLGRHPSDLMPHFFDRANVLLVSLCDSPLFNLYAPAKISSYMASGRPIIAALNGEGADVVCQADCGWSVAAEDSNALADLVIRLSESDPSSLEEKGANAKSYYNDYFEKNKCLSKLDTIMQI